MTDEEIIEEVVSLVDEGVSVTLPVNGNSMLPFIVGGRDSVILQKPEHPEVGDIALAWVQECRYVLHRIIQIDGERITLMGDGNIAGVEHCSVKEIKAVATHIVKADGKEYCLNGRLQRWSGALWRRLLPVRRYLLAIYRRI